MQQKAEAVVSGRNGIADEAINIDVLIGWSWEYDLQFVLELESRLQSGRTATTYRVTDTTIDEVLLLAQRGRLSAKVYYDRAFDVDDRYRALGELLRSNGCKIINDYDLIAHATDKASMHLEFIERGLYVPFSIILSPYNHSAKVMLTATDLAHLGRPFVIKPANTTGGSVGVVTGAETLLDVLETRTEFAEDKYLLQEKIEPRLIEGRRCWYRCFYVCGKIISTWWDDETHVYSPITPSDAHYYRLSSLSRIMNKIAAAAQLDFFSSEIALRESTSFEPSKFVVIDYVNDLCDMRTLRIAHDGLPDIVYSAILDRLALGMKRLAKKVVISRR